MIRYGIGGSHAACIWHLIVFAVAMFVSAGAGNPAYDLQLGIPSLSQDRTSMQFLLHPLAIFVGL